MQIAQYFTQSFDGDGQDHSVYSGRWSAGEYRLILRPRIAFNKKSHRLDMDLDKLVYTNFAPHGLLIQFGKPCGGLSLPARAKKSCLCHHLDHWTVILIK